MARTTWRGIITDSTTALALNEAARLVGNDIRLTPIPGCGSYQTTTAASAGTHAGGGVVDIDCEGYSDEQARRIETTLRRVGFAAWFRPRLSPRGVAYGWQRHVHAIRQDCADLSTPAREQVTDYHEGRNGLADGAADTGNRAYVAVTWARYLASITKPAGSSVPTAPKPAPAPKPVTHLGPVLRRGSRGVAVYRLQAGLLRTFPLYAGRIRRPGGGPNQLYGPNTEAVVREFQRRAHIIVDGIVGDQTWRALARFGIRP